MVKQYGLRNLELKIISEIKKGSFSFKEIDDPGGKDLLRSQNELRTQIDCKSAVCLGILKTDQCFMIWKRRLSGKF